MFVSRNILSHQCMFFSCVLALDAIVRAGVSMKDNKKQTFKPFIILVVLRV